MKTLTETQDIIRMAKLLDDYADNYGINSIEDCYIHDIWVELYNTCDKLGIKVND